MPSRKHRLWIPAIQACLALTARFYKNILLWMVRFCFCFESDSPDIYTNKQRLCLCAFCAFSIVIQQLLNQIDMCQHHSSAAVSLEAEFIQSITLKINQGQVIRFSNMRERVASNRIDPTQNHHWDHVYVWRVLDWWSLTLLKNLLVKDSGTSPTYYQ